MVDLSLKYVGHLGGRSEMILFFDAALSTPKVHMGAVVRFRKLIWSNTTAIAATHATSTRIITGPRDTL